MTWRVIASGTAPEEAIPGALTYRGARTIAMLCGQ